MAEPTTPPVTHRLDGETAIVTGADHGIGSATVEGLAARDVTDRQRAAVLPLTPIGRFAALLDLAAAVFPCPDGSSFLAGAAVGVDGGPVAP